MVKKIFVMCSITISFSILLYFIFCTITDILVLVFIKGEMWAEINCVDKVLYLPEDQIVSWKKIRRPENDHT